MLDAGLALPWLVGSAKPKTGGFKISLAHCCQRLLGWREKYSVYFTILSVIIIVIALFGIKRLRFEDVIKEEESETEADDPISRFDLDFSLMVLELAVFIPELMTALGGEALPDGEETATPNVEKQQQVEPELEPA